MVVVGPACDSVWGQGSARAAAAAAAVSAVELAPPTPLCCCALLRCSIGQDCEHLRSLHPLLLRLGCGPAEGAWRLAAEQLPLPVLLPTQ